MLDDDTAMPKHVPCNATRSEKCDLTGNSDSDNVHTHTHTHTYKSAPIINILNQRCPHIPQSCISDQHYEGKHCWNSENHHIHLNVILTTTPRFSKRVVSLQIFHKKYYTRFSLLSLSHACSVPSPSNLPLFDRPNNKTINVYLCIKYRF